MLEIVIKGIIIGLFLSVPLGPIGMLCIQRTLNRGRKFGIATGLGATFSDLLYTIITLFFLSFVIDIVEQNRFIIQLAGSIIVAIFGFFIFKSHPSTQPKPNEPAKHTLFGDFITSFALTISNPLVLFVLIALFARFEFINNHTTLIHSIVGISSILVGALIWWNSLTFLVSKFRNKLNMQGLKIINRITGIVIILIGVIGLILSLFK
ncbi:MAG: LysE family transporter [Paludibacter sp.]|nr:LysE family transporter [Paludibacter sp.]